MKIIKWDSTYRETAENTKSLSNLFCLFSPNKESVLIEAECNLAECNLATKLW